MTACYDATEAVRVQGINDLVIFGVAGAGSLGSGYVYSWLGWRNLVFCVSCLMALAAMFVGLSLVAAKRKREAADFAYAVLAEGR